MTVAPVGAAENGGLERTQGANSALDDPLWRVHPGLVFDVDQIWTDGKKDAGARRRAAGRDGGGIDAADGGMDAGWWMRDECGTGAADRRGRAYRVARGEAI